MAHGSKKFIRRFDGKIKRSNNRTKLDKYAELRYWSVPYSLYGGRWPFRKAHGTEHCPQCKHNFKILDEINQEYLNVHNHYHNCFVIEYKSEQEQWDKVWNEYHKKEGLLFDLYGGTDLRYLRFVDKWEFKKKHAHRIKTFRDYCLEHNIIEWYSGIPPYTDEKSYLCPKHRTWFDAERYMWRREFLPGIKDRENWTCKNERRKYRNHVKQLMRKAKYVEELYDEIPPPRRAWLD